MVYCSETLSLCVTGLITAIAALTWTIKQELKLRQIEKELNNNGETQ